MTNALSHEIKTPLARMQFELDFAQKAADIVPMRKSLENIKGDVEAINKLVKATLDYAILERAELEINFAYHDFTQILPALVDELRRDCPEVLRIRLEVAPGANHVRCDIHLIEAILKNLLNNARRYAIRQIAVTFSSELGMNRLLVEDDGPGIPEAQQARVFESFVKLDRTVGKEARFGLGLAIVKRAAEWHDGQVALSRSALGGARFEVSWPESAL
jgi:signal transduction histidine kinase